MRMRSTALTLVAAAAAVAATAATAGATTTTLTGGTTAVATRHAGGLVAGAHLTGNMMQSGNWSGYNKGALESGTFFHSVSGQWVVPTATQAKKGQAEASSSWVGIGGGCMDTSCLATDATLIQAGTEQDVDAKGKASYSAWYELIPAPSLRTPLAVSPGNTISVTIAETLPEVWKITMKNLSTGASWSTTVPYSSTYGTAEWIEETPVVIGGGSAGFSAMPKLGTVKFDNATANGASAALTPAEEMQLVDSNNKPLATPSAPDSLHDGFNDCTYAASCPTPSFA